MLPFMALALRNQAGRVGFSHAGDIRGNQAFSQYTEFFSTGYHADRIGNALYSAAETSI